MEKVLKLLNSFPFLGLKNPPDFFPFASGGRKIAALSGPSASVGLWPAHLMIGVDSTECCDHYVGGAGPCITATVRERGTEIASGFGLFFLEEAERGTLLVRANSLKS